MDDPVPTHKLRKHEKPQASDGSVGDAHGKGVFRSLSIEENNSFLSHRTLVDDIEKINSNGMDRSILSVYERDLKDLEMNLEWDEEENRPISELVPEKENGQWWLRGVSQFSPSVG